MRFQLMATALASTFLIAGCTVPTAGSQATTKGANDCVAAAARRFKEPAEHFRVDGSQMTLSSDVYDVQMTNTTTGRRAKCTVDQNGNVAEVIYLR